MKLQNFLPTGHFWDNALSILNARKRLGYFPNPRNPRSFNEHILAQKWDFRGDLSLAQRVTDKAEVKIWLSEMSMEHLIVPTLGVFENTWEIQAFHFSGEIIAKSTHGSGEALIRAAQDGRAFSLEDLETFRSWFSEDYYKRSREPNYKGLRKRVIVEPVLRDETGNVPKDFKFFCADGEPFAIQVDHGRHTHHTRQLYDTSWQLLPYSMCYERPPTPMAKPVLLEEALATARQLSKGFGFARVDFYFMPKGLKLGEMTFFPENGAGRFMPREGDMQMGRQLMEARNSSRSQLGLREQGA
ncbi:ATP-grasp fold amidoligase family protein [Pseudovibrio ascidiaceicola]|uniref:ATP-grasp fold amidoligase family protein n=1 Tax=Pseudovibrio ascidiaceicola TaxID=285279 RepID=UPI000D694016|nr:ATP-grasp fold amidoligase family protein [Pseudovibrio ascidiaceicola]